jgi:hypothetical protein
MKKITLALLLLISVGFVQAQNNAINTYFSNYAEDEAFSKITITGKMFEMMNHIEVENQEEEDLKEALSKIEGIGILINEKMYNSKAVYKQAIGKVGNRFETLMTVQDDDADVEFMIDENNGIIDELLIIVGSDSSFVIVDIWGEIDLSTIRTLTEKMDLTGMEHYNEKDAAAIQYISMYPNPIRQGKNPSLKIPENFKGSTLRVHDLKGKQLQERVLNDLNTEVQLGNMPVGSYVVTIWKGNIKAFNETVVVVK